MVISHCLSHISMVSKRLEVGEKSGTCLAFVALKKVKTPFYCSLEVSFYNYIDETNKVMNV